MYKGWASKGEHTSTRKYANLIELPGVWQDVTAALHSEQLQHVVFDALEVDFMERFGTTRPVAYPRARLLRDEPGYVIEPHTDVVPNKVATLQFYLPADESNVNFGTVMYDENKIQVEQMKFLPNTGYAFAVTHKSWHAVVPFSGNIRYTIIVSYYTKPKGPFPKAP